MAKRNRPAKFEVPRDDEGHFLPKELWTRRELREYERLKAAGKLKKNPVIKKKKGRKTKKVWDSPRDARGHYLPYEQWSAAQKREYEKAKKKGWITADQTPRDDKGRWVSKDGKKRKKAKQGDAVDYPVPVGADGAAQIQHLGGGVTVVYPPYPPQPVPVVPTPQTPPPMIVQLPSQYPAEMALAAGAPAQLTRERHVRTPIRGGVPQWDEAHLDQTERVNCDVCLDDHDRALLLGQQRTHNRLERLEDLNEEQISRLEACVPQLTGEEETDLIDVDELETPLSWNPRRRRYPQYYVERTFAEKLDDAVSFLRAKPLLALVAVGAMVAIGYALYRVFSTLRTNLLSAGGGVNIANGTISFPGEQPYQVTEADKLWLARAIFGEVNRNPAAWSQPAVQQGGAAVLYAFANHFMTVGNKRGIYRTLGDFAQGYSQPINPRWIDPNGSKCQRSPGMCTPDRIAFRRALRARQWHEFPVSLQNLVLSFVAGRVPNPIGTRTDFRAAGTDYRPADMLNVADNIFGTAPNARRPAQQVA